MNSSELARELGKILAKRQAELDMSLRTLSERSGVSHMTVKRTLDGDNSVSVNTFMDVAHALNLTAWRVYREAEEKLRPGLSVVADTVEGPNEALLAADKVRKEEEQPEGN